MSSYIAILGRQPELGLIELESVLGSDAVEAYGKAALLADRPEFAHLGGTVKLARLIQRMPDTAFSELMIESSLLGLPPEGKITFAVSYYGPKIQMKDLREFGIRLKKVLKSGRSVRFVAPKIGETSLTAAQLKYNGIPEHGFELILVRHAGELVIGVTEAVQDIDAYTARDHGRPARSAKVGMLPPKLAQILINTTSAPLVYDPFCGTGVIGQEALLMGRATAGSDLAPDMVEASRLNLGWLEHQYEVAGGSEFIQADAREVKLPAVPLAIVSEGYLGPNLIHKLRPDQLDRQVKPLRELYIAALRNFAAQIPTGTEVSICAPAWSVNGHWEPLPLLDVLPDLGYTTKVFKASPHGLPVYGRPDQAVGRALYLLTKV